MGYPTQKPEELVARIVKMASNKDDLVADFFCGSAPILGVAKKMRRRFLGCDVNPDAIEIAEKRMEKTSQFRDITDFFAKEKRTKNKKIGQFI